MRNLRNMKLQNAESRKPLRQSTVQSPPCQRPGSVCFKTAEPLVSISKTSTALLAFVVCGGLVFELLRVVPELWSTTISFFNRLLA